MTPPLFQEDNAPQEIPVNQKNSSTTSSFRGGPRRVNDKHHEPASIQIAPEWVLEEAIRIAVEAHLDRRDRQGRPSILHSLRVMLTAQSDAARAVAVLHDVLEDTSVEEFDLRFREIPEEIIEAVVAITRTEDETYADYIFRLSENPLAREVKLLDLGDNIGRLHELPSDECRSLGDRYRKAWRVLAK